MTEKDQLSFLKHVRRKLSKTVRQVDQYIDYLVELKTFIEARENRFDELIEIESLADKLLKELDEFEKNEKK